MQKKKYDLTADLIEVKLGDGQEEKIGKKVKILKTKKVLLTLSVDFELHKQFKTWCARNSLKMNEAFIKGFNELRNKY